MRNLFIRRAVRTGLSSALLAAVAPAAAGPPPASSPSDQRPGAAKENEPALKLIPSTAAPDDAVLTALTANPWVLAGPVKILGGGSTESLQFTTTKDPKDGPLTAESTFHVIPDVNHRNKPGGGKVADRTESHPCRVIGPVLRYGGARQSFVVLKGRMLVVNALVPTGEGKWYYAAGDPGPAGRPGRVEEYLFTFDDDPLKKNTGKATMTVRVGDFPPKGQSVRFALTREVQGRRYFQVEVEGPNGTARLARIALSADGDYGLMLDNPNLNSQIFSPASAARE